MSSLVVRTRRRFSIVAAAAVGVALFGASAVSATLPGRNGGLAFSALRWHATSDEFLVDKEYLGFAPLGGGARHMIARGVDPAFSPDGQRLAYARPGGENQGIWLTRPGCRWPRSKPAPAACSALRRLTRGYDIWPSWSPDGRRIAFTRSSDSRIYTVASDGGKRRLVTRGNEPDWSSRGQLAFYRGSGGILVSGPRGERVRRLTRFGTSPSWSPQGDRVAFSADHTGIAGAGLYVIGADGSGLRRIWPARRQDEYSDYPTSPSWSPDGRLVAFIEGDYGFPQNGAVWAIRPNGTGLRVLTPTLPNCRNCFKKLYFDGLAWQPLRRPAGGTAR